MPPNGSCCSSRVCAFLPSQSPQKGYKNRKCFTVSTGALSTLPTPLFSGHYDWIAKFGVQGPPHSPGPTTPECWASGTDLVVAGEEGELLGLQELRLGDVQAIFPVQELHHTAVAVANGEIILDDEPLQVLDDAPVWRPGSGPKLIASQGSL